MMTVADICEILSNYPSRIIAEIQMKNSSGTWCIAPVESIAKAASGSPVLSAYENEAVKDVLKTSAIARNKLLHMLWGKAVGTPEYDKSQWQELQKLIE